MENNHNTPQGNSNLLNISLFPQKKTKLNFGLLKTQGTNQLSTEFQGETQNELSKLGVTVYNTSEIEKNLISQAKELSKQSKDHLIALCQPIEWKGTTSSVDTLIKQWTELLNSKGNKRTTDYQQEIMILRLKLNFLNQIKRMKSREIKKSNLDPLYIIYESLKSSRNQRQSLSVSLHHKLNSISYSPPSSIYQISSNSEQTKDSTPSTKETQTQDQSNSNTITTSQTISKSIPTNSIHPPSSNKYIDMYGRERTHYTIKDVKKIEATPPVLIRQRRRHFIIRDPSSSEKEDHSQKDSLFYTIKKQQKKKKNIQKKPSIIESSPVNTQTNPSDIDITKCCPICFQTFPATMSITRRQHHVNSCLERGAKNKTQHSHSPRSPTKSSDSYSEDTDDSLFETDSTTIESMDDEEDLLSQFSDSRSINQTKSTKRRSTIQYIPDDSNDDVYYHNLELFLKWRKVDRGDDDFNPTNPSSTQNISTKQANEELIEQYMNEFINQVTKSNARLYLNSDTKLYNDSTIEDIQCELYNFYINEKVINLDSSFCIPEYLYNQLYPYQQVGLKWLINLYVEGVGGILADEMGLGKTLQVISFLCVLKYTNERNRLLDIIDSNESTTETSELTYHTIHSIYSKSRYEYRILLLCPATLLTHWIREIRHWGSILRVLVLHKNSESILSGYNYKDILESIEEGYSDICVCTYEGFKKYRSYILANNWNYLILDEGAKIKNTDTEIARCVKLINTVNRLIISGTPLQNNLKEIWSLFDFINPGRLGDLQTFTNNFIKPIYAGLYKNSTKYQNNVGYECSTTLQNVISPFILRRKKKEVECELPPKTEQILFCTLTKNQRDLYKHILQMDIVHDTLAGSIQPFAAISLLRKVCNFPALLQMNNEQTKLIEGKYYQTYQEFQSGSSYVYQSGDWQLSGKMMVLKSILNLWKQENHKVLLYTQTVQMLNILEGFINEMGYSYLSMTGNTPVDTRQALIDEFNSDPSIFVFLLTTKVGGIGICLQGADRVLIYDPDWNPSSDIQACERCWRIGQHNPVTIYRLITAGTIEEKVYHRQVFKLLLTEQILDDTNSIKNKREKSQIFTSKADELYENSETGTMFPSAEVDGKDIQNSSIPGLVNRSNETVEDTMNDKNHRTDEENEKQILFALFDKNELKSIFSHDSLMNEPIHDTVNDIKLQAQAKRQAQEALESLRQTSSGSYIPNHSLYSGIQNTQDTSENVSSKCLLDRIKMNQQKRNVDPTSQRLVKQVINFFKQQKNYTCTTDAILNRFKSIVSDSDKFLFRQIIQDVASFKHKQWTLRSQWR